MVQVVLLHLMWLVCVVVLRVLVGMVQLLISVGQLLVGVGGAAGGVGGGRSRGVGVASSIIHPHADWLRGSLKIDYQMHNKK